MQTEKEILLEALRLLRDLAELQNGTPLVQYEQEYNQTMKEVWDFLQKHNA